MTRIDNSAASEISARLPSLIKRFTNPRLTVLTVCLVCLFVVTVLLERYLVSLPLLRPILGVVIALVLPGLLVLRLLGLNAELRLSWAPYIVGISAVVTMAVWFMVNTGLLFVGYQRPISFLPLFLGLVLALGVFTGVLYVRAGVDRVELPVPTREVISPTRLFYALVPLATVLVVTYLNVTGNTQPITVLLILIAVTPVILVGTDRGDAELAFVVWMLALALLFHKSLYYLYTFGGHVSVVTVWQNNAWMLSGGESLLPNAVLMPSLAHLLGLNILTLVKVTLPLIVSFLPVSVFLMAKRAVKRDHAFLASCLIMFAHPFYFQYPSAPRASMPVFFLALIGAVTLDGRISALRKKLLTILFGFGVAVSHYGTAYYVMLALLATAVTITVLPRFYKFSSYLSDKYKVWRGPKTLYDRDAIDKYYALLFFIIVITWYSNIGGGNRFGDLIENLYSAYLSLFVGVSGGGSTAARLSTDYGSLSIFLSKHLYLIIAAMSGLGLAAMTLKRLKGDDLPVSDGFLFFSLHVFLLFGGSFIISGSWGGGRPMMIVLSLAAVFVVIGLQTIRSTISWPIQTAFKVVQNRSELQVLRRASILSDRMTLATFLAVFLLLNTGVMATVAYGGEAPSMVPVDREDSTYLETDISTHVWFTQHRDERIKIYGDQVAWAQPSDWFNGEVAARTGAGSYRFKKPNLGKLNGTGVEDGYVILLGHNLIGDIVSENYIIKKPIGAYDLDRANRSKVYTTGKSAVYFHNSTTD